jgi:hemerythrin-like domain-containing protein
MSGIPEIGARRIALMPKEVIMDAVWVLKEDHKNVSALIQEYFASPSSEVLADIVKELSVHAAIEEQHVYPKIREVVPGGDKLADQAIEEHQAVKELLAELDGADGKDPSVTAGVSVLREFVEQHVEEEESALLPELTQHCELEDLKKLGQTLETAKTAAPTHPHPNAPARPPGNAVVGPALAAVDRLRDAISGKR